MRVHLYVHRKWQSVAELTGHRVAAVCCCWRVQVELCELSVESTRGAPEHRGLRESELPPPLTESFYLPKDWPLTFTLLCATLTAS